MKEQFENKQEERDFEDALIALNYNGHRYNDWFHIKQWLWEKYKIDIRRYQDEEGRIFSSVSYWKNILIAHKNKSEDSPITAEIEGIKAAVNHLHKQL